MAGSLCFVWKFSISVLPRMLPLFHTNPPQWSVALLFPAVLCMCTLRNSLIHVWYLIHAWHTFVHIQTLSQHGCFKCTRAAVWGDLSLSTLRVLTNEILRLKLCFSLHLLHMIFSSSHFLVWKSNVFQTDLMTQFCGPGRYCIQHKWHALYIYTFPNYLITTHYLKCCPEFHNSV